MTGERLIRVTSSADRRVAIYRDLTDSAHRRAVEHRDGVFVAEGPRTIRQLIDLRWPLRSVLLLEGKLAGWADLVAGAGALGADVLVAGSEMFDSIAGFPVHRGALAVAIRPPERPAADILSGRPTLVIEAVNDHENLGALFRNAAAFGVGAVLLDQRAADPLYRRSVRVSLGHVLRVPFARVHPWPGGLDVVRRAGYQLVALSPRASRSIDDFGPGGRIAVMVGSEADGLSQAAVAAADDVVRIPMAAGIDSLNVATAAAVALQRLCPLVPVGSPAAPA